MTPESLTPPDMERFTGHKDDLVAFEATAIVALAVYIMFLHWLYGKNIAKFSDALQNLSTSVTALTEAFRNVKTK